ncbi:MAG: hypothetical protein FWG61_03115 [Firmicutes bacterium]|nr:hypothetical protein [Bacillota bacterium]
MKKFILVAMVIVLALALAIPALAAPGNGNGNSNGNVGTQNDYIGGVGVKVDKNNANFHCNTFGGNGRVWPEQAIDEHDHITLHDFKKSPFTFVFNHVEGTTKWTLEDVLDGTTSVGKVVCPECGSTLWISFSNNSGAPDGKNIQLQHPMVDIEIVKVWLDAQGNVVKDPKGLAAKFDFEYQINANHGNKTVSPGKISVPTGIYTVSELLNQLAKNYTLIDVASDTFDIDDDVATIEITPEMALEGGKYTVTFTNKEDPYAIILKEWADGNPEALTALFDVYEYDEDDFLGDLVKGDVKANEKVYVEPGIYAVSEQVKPGYVIQPDQVVEVGEGEIATVEFINTPNITPKGSLSFTKNVEGIKIIDWLTAKGLDADILDGLEFYLNGIGIDGNPHSYGPENPGYFTGEVVFGEVVPGTYTLSEEITGAAVNVFKKMADIEIVIGDGENNHFVLGGTVNGNISGPDIMKGDKFTIINGYGRFDWGYDGNGIGYPGLNASGHIFYIGVINERTKEEFYSFCANGGSTNFAEGFEQYMVAHSMVEKDWIMAFNYINDKYGDLNDNRVITQLVTWALLGAVDVDSEAFENTILKDDEKAAIKDVMANYNDYVGNGEVVDVLFMTYIDTPFNEDGTPNYTTCQPQVVPVFGKFYVENEPEDITPKGDISFTKTKFGGLISVGVNEFAFTLYQIVDGEEIKINNPDQDNGNFYTDFFGKVSTGNILTPGSYVFREVLTTYEIPGITDYKLIWKADDLYFDINDKGEAIWKNTDQNNPTLDNTLWNKSVMQWVAEIQTGAGIMGEALDGGYIFYPGGQGGDAVIFKVTYPKCTQGGVIWFFYSNEDGTNGEPLMSIAFAEALGHVWELNTFGDGLRCSECGLDIGWWELSKDLYELYKTLGGTGEWGEGEFPW